MKKLIKISIFLLILSNIFMIRSQCTYTDYADVRIYNSNILHMAENSIAVNPNCPNILLNANNTESSQMSAFISTDWGNTWSGGIIDPNNSFCDPAAAIDLNGRLYVAYLTYGLDQKIAFSDDLGQNWSYRYIVQHNFYEAADKDHLHIDNSLSSSFKGHIYCAWTNQNTTTNSNRIQISYSTDAGNSWATPISIGTTNDNRQLGVNITTDNSGNVYVVWAIYNINNWNKIELSKSTDGGQSWSIINEIYTYTALKTYSCEGPSLTCNMQNNCLFIVYSGQTTPTNYDVYMFYSTDGGNYWWPQNASGSLVNQNTNGDQTYPWISCDPQTGYLACVYYDTRTGSSHKYTYLSISTNSGTNWCDMQVSNHEWVGSGSVNSDYIGVEFNKGIIYPVWSDTRDENGDQDTKTYISPVDVILRDIVIPNLTINSYHDPFTSTRTLTANNFVIQYGGSVVFETVHSITLNPGFEADAGSNFIAELFNCENGATGNYNNFIVNTPKKSTAKIQKDNLIPDKFGLSQNYPNPFNPTTIINYQLPINSNVKIVIYNLLGQLVKILADEYQYAGYRSVIWDGTNNYNEPVSTGVYFYKIAAGTFVDKKKMVVIR